MNEADTCTKYVVPKLVFARGDTAPRSFTEQRSFTDCRVYVRPESKTRRGEKERIDHLLHYTRDYAMCHRATCSRQPRPYICHIAVRRGGPIDVI